MLWATAALIVGLHLLALPQVFIDSALRADTDTAVMLDAMRDSGGWRGIGRWLTGDWFLENGFYRPTTCLSLILDYTLYGERAWGYRLTNWLLMLLTALGVLMAVRAFAREVGFAQADALGCVAALLFSLQQTGLTALFKGWSTWWFVGGLWLVGVFVGAVPHPRAPSPEASGEGVSQSLSPSRGEGTGEGVSQSLSPSRGEGTGEGVSQSLSPSRRKSALMLALIAGAWLWGFERAMGTGYERLISWVPSRTALVMTVLSVWGVYCLLLGARQGRWGWLLLGLLLLLLALGAYEQAITLVPLLIALALARRRAWGRATTGALCTGAIAAAIVVITLRLALVPLEPSRYQQQQLRSSLAGPLWSYFSDLFPPVGDFTYWQTVLPEPMLWLFREPWDHLLMLLAYAGVLVALYQWRTLIGSALLWQAVTFLPMAFLHPFEHYSYLPQIGATTFDAALLLWGLSGNPGKQAR